MQNILKTLIDKDYELVSIDANCNWKLVSGPARPPMARNNGLAPPSMDPKQPMVPNGLVKNEPYDSFCVKQEPVGTPGSLAFKQEPLISALSVKREANMMKGHTKPDPDAPSGE